MDIAASSVGLLVLSPVGLLIAALIKLSDRGPVFYGQTRIGQFGRPFRIWKFRSMVVDADKQGLAVTAGADQRITPIGRILRRTKLDELPQLWNVLVGEMSLVGPRPEVPRYVEKYTPEQRAVLELRPGITDLASLVFRNEEEVLRGAKDVEGFYLEQCLPKKIELNLDYAKRANLLRDVWIILQTVVPYWMGVLGLYAGVLALSLWASLAMLADFHWSTRETVWFRGSVIWMVVPSLVCLFWQRQARGMLSYFSIPEFRRTAIALAVAVPVQMVASRSVWGTGGPGMNLFLMNAIMSLFALSGVRMGFRLVREQSMRAPRVGDGKVWRVAIVGTGGVATDLALGLLRRRSPRTRVVAFFDDDPRRWQMRPHDIPVLGMPECLLNPEWGSRLDEVIIAEPRLSVKRLEEIEAILRELPVTVTSSVGLGEDRRSEIGRPRSGAGVRSSKIADRETEIGRQ